MSSNLKELSVRQLRKARAETLEKIQHYRTLSREAPTGSGKSVQYDKHVAGQRMRLKRINVHLERASRTVSMSAENNVKIIKSFENFLVQATTILKESGIIRQDVERVGTLDVLTILETLANANRKPSA